MQFLNLEDVCNLQTQKESLKKERSQCSRSISQMKQNTLYHDIFSRLKGDQGRPVNPQEYLIHCSSAGSVSILPIRTDTEKIPFRKDDGSGVWQTQLTVIYQAYHVRLLNEKICLVLVRIKGVRLSV